jgi:hypothetical protein
VPSKITHTIIGWEWRTVCTQTIKTIKGNVKIMKILNISLVMVLLLLGCASTKVLDYSKVETHQAIVASGEYPQMAIPAEMGPWLDAVEEDMDLVKVGSIVDDEGNICFFLEHKETGECSAVVILLTVGGSVHPMSCETAMEMYEDLCVTRELCSEDIYLDGKI